MQSKAILSPSISPSESRGQETTCILAGLSFRHELITAFSDQYFVDGSKNHPHENDNCIRTDSCESCNCITSVIIIINSIVLLIRPCQKEMSLGDLGLINKHVFKMFVSINYFHVQ